jgi:hypothetical protein
MYDFIQVKAEKIENIHKNTFLLSYFQLKNFYFPTALFDILPNLKSFWEIQVKIHHSGPLYPEVMGRVCSKIPSGCLKLCVVCNPKDTMLYAVYICL